MPYIFVYKMSKMACIFIVAYTFLSAYAFSDIVRTVDDRSIEGVVIYEGQSGIKISTRDGDEKIERKDIAKISYDDAKDNLVFLAELASKKGEYAKAYFLYEKILALDPEFKPAEQYISSIDSCATGKAGIKDWGLSYERFQDQPNDCSQSAGSLSDDSYQTEQLMQKLGLILDKHAGGVVVREAVAQGLAYGAGVRSNDFIKNVNGHNADYMGLFDVIDTIVCAGSVRITVQREIICWIGNIDGVTEGLLKEYYGLILEKCADGFAVLEVGEGSPMATAGLMINDIIVYIDSIECRTISSDRADEIFKGKQGSYMRLIIARDFVI